MKKNKLIFTVLTVLVLFLSCKNNLVAKLESGHSAPVDVKAINVNHQGFRIINSVKTQ